LDGKTTIRRSCAIRLRLCFIASFDPRVAIKNAEWIFAIIAVSVALTVFAVASTAIVL
jgi:hypothetical protein